MVEHEVTKCQQLCYKFAYPILVHLVHDSGDPDVPPPFSGLCVRLGYACTPNARVHRGLPCETPTHPQRLPDRPPGTGRPARLGPAGTFRPFTDGRRTSGPAGGAGPCRSPWCWARHGLAAAPGPTWRCRHCLQLLPSPERDTLHPGATAHPMTCAQDERSGHADHPQWRFLQMLALPMEPPEPAGRSLILLATAALDTGTHQRCAAGDRGAGLGSAGFHPTTHAADVVHCGAANTASGAQPQRAARESRAGSTSPNTRRAWAAGRMQVVTHGLVTHSDELATILGLQDHRQVVQSTEDMVLRYNARVAQRYPPAPGALRRTAD